MVQRAIRIQLPNQPGQLGRVTRLLGEADVNIQALCAVGGGDRGTVELLVDSHEAAARVMDEAGIQFTYVEVAIATLPHRPGMLARASVRLGEAAINIDSCYVVATSGAEAQVAFGTADAARADQLLEEVRRELEEEAEG